MNRLTLAVFLSATVCALLAAPLFGTGASETPVSAAAARPGIYPLTVPDDGGSNVTVEAKPARIVSLTLFTDDILLELVDRERILAVTTFAGDPDISNVADRVADIPNRLTLNVEMVLALEPDLVFVSNWSEADKVKQLRDAGVAVYLAGTGVTVQEIQEKIRRIAEVVGEVDRGKELVAWMDGKLKGVSDRLSSLPQSRRLSVVDYAVWGSAQGKGSSWDEIVRLAGLLNAVGELTADEYGQVPLSKEKLVELDPDLLVLPGWVYGDPQGADAFYKQTVEDPALASMKSVRLEHAIKMPERLKSTVSQYIVQAVEFLARAAYPELFR